MNHTPTLPADLLQELVRAARGTGGPPTVPAGQRDTLEDWLRHALVNPAALHDHLLWLKNNPPPAGPGQSAYDLREVVLHKGLSALEDDALAALALNPIALAGLYDLIDETMPEAWLKDLRADGQALLAEHRLELDLSTFQSALAAPVPARAGWRLLERLKEAPAVWRDALFVLLAVLLSAGLLWVISPSLVDWSEGRRLAPLDWWGRLQYVALGASLTLVGLVLLSGSALRRWGELVRPPAVILAVSLLAVLGAMRFAGAESEKSHITDDLRDMLAHRWVCYEPPDMNSYTEETPSEEVLRRQLTQLREEGGFDGVITYLSHGSMKEIPRIAKEVGFKVVIMGIYLDERNPDSRTTHTQAAIDARAHVDAYCLGHHVPASQVDLRKLAEWMTGLRRATGRPVTTTFPLVHYLGERGKALREMGDFYFPDVCGSFRFGTTPEKGVEELRQSVERLSQLPRDKPVLLKAICYPSGGAAGLTEDGQYEFHERVFRELSFPDGVTISLYNAYDLPLRKLNPADYTPADQFVGLFTVEGKAKRVVSELLSTGRFPVISPFGVNTPLRVEMRGTLQFTRPKGAPQHQPNRARYFRVSRELPVEWDRPEQELTIQVYQRGQLQGEWKGVRSGTVLALPKVDGAKDIRAREPIELKAWIEGEEVPETAIWIWIE